MQILMLVALVAQWLNHPDPRIPRTRDGKPNLSAPAPRRDGKIDLSGIWQVESSPGKEVERLLLPGAENGLGESVPNKYFLNFFSDFPFLQEPFHPAAKQAFMQRLQQKPSTLCPPPSVPVADMLPLPYKIFQMPGVTLMLYEADTNFFRQIFTDGRKLPADPQPSWLGYSVGKWDGDWFVVDSVGFNDKSGLDAMGHPHSESMRLTERFRRRDYGHMDLEITLDDPKTYTKPVTIKVAHQLHPDTEILESFCSEGEKDLTHMRGQ
jgi:hypothetical protein